MAGGNYCTYCTWCSFSGYCYGNLSSPALYQASRRLGPNFKTRPNGIHRFKPIGAEVFVASLIGSCTEFRTEMCRIPRPWCELLRHRPFTEKVTSKKLRKSGVNCKWHLALPYASSFCPFGFDRKESGKAGRSQLLITHDNSSKASCTNG